MDRWTTEETEDGFRLNYSEDFSVYAYADAAALEEIKDAHNAERDRLAAENAELRKWKADLEAKIAAASKIGMEFGEMEFDAWFPGSRPKTRKELTAELAAANTTLEEERAAYAVLLESHEIILDALTESDATLDALREAVPVVFGLEYGEAGMAFGKLCQIQDILYPQPAALAKEKTNGN